MREHFIPPWNVSTAKLFKHVKLLHQRTIRTVVAKLGGALARARIVHHSFFLLRRQRKDSKINFANRHPKIREGLKVYNFRSSLSQARETDLPSAPKAPIY